MANEQNLRPSKSDLHPTMKPIGLLAIQKKIHQKYLSNLMNVLIDVLIAVRQKKH